MKAHKLLTACLIFVCLACNSEDVNDCLQTQGDLTSNTLELPFFDKIRLEENVELILTQSATTSVTLTTGENLRNDVDVFVENETLVARDNNGCNFFRDYNVTVLKVSSPNIVSIINGSSFEVRSNGILNYPTITLRSLVIPGFQLRKNGDFRLQLNSDKISVVANGSSVFYLSGQVEELGVSFSDELPRLEAKDLKAQHINIRHVSSNHAFVNPQQSLTAELRGSGNVYSFNRPDTTDITELYTGRVIFVE